jgi:lipoate-protein ligase A
VVNVTLVFTPDGPPDLKRNYHRLCSPIEQTLGSKSSRGWNPGAFCDGEYNVQWNGKKFAGTAQRLRKCRDGRSSVLAHALMLIKPPSRDAIDALNLFLDLMNEPRRIEADCHTGLPDNTNTDDFINRLHKRYLETLP